MADGASDPREGGQDRGEEELSGQGSEGVPSADLGQDDKSPDEVAQELGFKDWKSLVAAQREGHKTITRLSQDKAALERTMQMIQGQFQHASDTGGTVEEDPAAIAWRAANTAMVTREVNSALSKEPPEKQQKLRQYMLEALMENPAVGNMPDPVGTLLARAKERDAGEAESLVKSIFGEDATLEDVRKLRGGKSQSQSKDRLIAGYHPEEGPSRSSPSDKQTSYEEKERKRYRDAMDVGDVDTVTDIVFRDTSKIIKGQG